MKKAFATNAAIILMLSAGSASASILIESGNNPQGSTEETIQFGANQLSTKTIFGTTNQSNTTVEFSSTELLNSGNGQGQAMITAVDGAINNITFSIPGGEFTDYIFDAKAANIGTGTITVNSTLNGTTETPTVQAVNLDVSNNGENFFTILASDNELITSVVFDVGSNALTGIGGFGELKQPRVSGACTGTSCTTTVPGGQTVPEPSSLLIIGAGLVGVGIARRLRRPSLAT